MDKKKTPITEVLTTISSVIVALITVLEFVLKLI